MIIDKLRKEYSVNYLCKLMNVNRSEYYKWQFRKNNKNKYKLNRDILTELLILEHNKHKSFGYHHLAAIIRNQINFTISDNLVHKCCRFANIKSHAKHYKYRHVGEENKTYANVVNGQWNAKKPLEIVVSDMNKMRQGNIMYE